MPPLVQLVDVSRSYGSVAPVRALRGVDLEVDAGELVSVVGASGSGKTTLLNIIGCLDRPTTGSYRLDGVDADSLSDSRRAGLRSRLLGFVFQSFNLIAFKTALENVALPLYYQGVPRRKRNELAREYLDRVGLADWAAHLPRELSGGQQQRVAIARALIANPKVICADEPTGALDSQTSFEIMDLLRDINASGVTMLIVTHEREIAARTRRVIRLRDGEVAGDGAPDVEAPLPAPRVAVS